MELLGDEAKALPIYAAAVAWEDFAKRLESMGGIENFRTVRFWDVIVAYYAAYLTGLLDWQRHGMPHVDVVLPALDGRPIDLPAQKADQDELNNAHPHPPVGVVVGVPVIVGNAADKEDDHNDPE